MKTVDFVTQRNEMVEHQIKSRGVRDRQVLDAMRAVPRELFLPDELHEFAYHDTPLPIADNQTISQPYIVAFMIEALGLRGCERALEIGTGSGYAAAVLSHITGSVYTVERIRELADQSSAILKSLGYHNVYVRCDDGTLGWAEKAPFDAIIVAAGSPTVPESLLSQLKVGGRIVIPVGEHLTGQELTRITKVTHSKYKSEDIADVRFVPLIGAGGWEDISPTRAAPTKKNVGENHQ